MTGKPRLFYAQYLTGNWREEHLFNLASVLRLFDTLETEIASYEARLLKELEALQPPEREQEPVPPHPNPAKQRAIKNRGEQQARTTLWRFAGVDLTRIDGISPTAAQVVLTEVGPNLGGLGLCPRTPISGGKPVKKGRNGLGPIAFQACCAWRPPRCSAPRPHSGPISAGWPAARAAT